MPLVVDGQRSDAIESLVAIDQVIDVTAVGERSTEQRQIDRQFTAES